MHDAPRQSIVGQILNVIAVGDDPHVILRGNEDVLRASQVCPLPKKMSVSIKDLDAVVLAIAHIDGALRIYGHGMRNLKLAWAVARFAPSQKILAIPRKLNH